MSTELISIVSMVMGYIIGRVWAWSCDGRPLDRPLPPPARPAPPMPKCKPARTEIQVLPPNVDRLILSYPEFLSAEQRVQMQKLLKDAWEDDTRKVIVLEGGIKIEAVTLMQGEKYNYESRADRPKPFIPQPGTGRENKQPFPPSKTDDGTWAV